MPSPEPTLLVPAHVIAYSPEPVPSESARMTVAHADMVQTL